MSRGGLQLIQDGTAKSRFPCSDVACDLNEPLSRSNAVKEAGKSIQVFAAEENKSGVRGYIERRFAQTKIIVIHEGRKVRWIIRGKLAFSNRFVPAND